MESTPKAMIWTGRVLSTLIVLMLLMGSIMSIIKTDQAVKGSVEKGYPESVVRPLGITSLCCIILYAIPQTSMLGAILLTGYLGGAVATHVRVGEWQFVFAVVVGILTWLALFLRDARIRALIPIKSV